MGYVLRNGKRYYQDSDGKLILDNVSQHEADCRGRQSAGESPVCHDADTGATGACLGLVGLMIVVLMLLVGACIYNRCSVSPAEQAIEDYMNWYSKLKGLNYAALRYFNAAGYDIEGVLYGLEQNPANLLPIIMETACGMRSQMKIFGDDYELQLDDSRANEYRVKLSIPILYDKVHSH